MDEQTTVKPDGTQVTTRTAPVTPNLEEACQAIVTTQIVICQPMSDGTWQLVSSLTDNYNIILDNRESDAARDEVLSRITEVKDKWIKNQQIISLENLLTTGRPNSLRTEANNTSPAPIADDN